MEILSILCDAVQSVAIHNGVARIRLMRLDADGHAQPVLELHMPVGQVGTLAKAAQSAMQGGRS
jgi:hypothetical protein